MPLDKNDLWEGGSDHVIAYFQRHGSTSANDANLFRGPIDYPLDEHGLRDAHEAADFFKNIDLGDAWSSDKQRAETTARAVLQPKGMQFQSDPNLRAWNTGYMAGQSKDLLKDDIDYFQRHPDEQIPDGESLNQFRDRVHPSILRALQSGIATGKPSITFCHSSICKEVGHMLNGDHNAGNVNPGGVLAVTHGTSGFKAHGVFKARKGTAGYGT